MRNRLAIFLVLFFAILQGKQTQAQTPQESVAGMLRLIMDSQELITFQLPAEEKAAQETLQHLLADHPFPSVNIRTAASPDGNTDENKERSRLRAEAARQLVRTWLPNLPDSRIAIHSVGEDYETLHSLLQGSDIPGAADAARIIETVPIWVTRGGLVVSSRKKQLMDLRGGQTWEQMREEFFPLLKQAQITISFAEQPVRNDGPILIYFPFDDASVRPDYRTNRQSLARLDSLLKDSVPAPGDTIVLVGKASMDGPASYNATLSRRRADAIRRYIDQRYPSYAGVLSIRAEGEPWSEMREAVAADGQLLENTRRRLLEIIDSEVSADRKEVLLKTVPGWRDFARTHYPGYRISSVTPHHTTWLLPLTEEELVLESPDLPDTAGITLLPDRIIVPELMRRRILKPVLGISTNLPYDITYIPDYGLTSIPSLSLEYYPVNARHLTYGLDLEWPMWKHWDRRDFLQINNLTLWARRYFKTREERFRGLYLLGSVNGARFGVGTDGTGWEGEGLGASVGLGHKWILGRSRLFIDAGLSAGVFYAQYDPYVYGNDATDRYYYDYAGDPARFTARNHRWIWVGPTRLYFSLGIDLFNRHPKRTKR